MAHLISQVLGKLGLVEPDTKAGPLTEQALRQWLINRVAQQLKADPSSIDTARDFGSYGLDSIVALQVAGELEKLVERRLSPVLLFEHQNIDELTAHLAGELGLSKG